MEKRQYKGEVEIVYTGSCTFDYTFRNIMYSAIEHMNGTLSRKPLLSVPSD